MNYVAYLIKAPHAPVIYDAWVCGGAIVHPEFIITSAACIEDVQFMYAIAGYKKYVNFKDIDNDPCTKASKKKIVISCVPKSYNFAYEKVTKWAYIDIGVVRVDTPYDFSLKSPLPSCSWVPRKIAINYDVKYQQPGTDTIVMGWGHDLKWRRPDDTKDYNQATLKYSPLLIQDKEKCKDFYTNIDGMDKVIEKYMICGLDEGNINSKGDQIARSHALIDGCANNYIRVGGICQSPQSLNITIWPVETEKPITPPPPKYYTPTQPPASDAPSIDNIPSDVGNGSEDDATITFDDIAFSFRRTEMGRKLTNFSRRTGICQNDHGGPLVTWVGKNEVLIGVASVFRVSQRFDCIGPFLFTSTQCNGAFLNCIINNMTSTRRDPVCEQPAEERGFEIVERRISWKHHPDGPAANEHADDVFDSRYPIHY
ncbi:uncharacterized protein LOC126376948 [Pectinophora gossypiella]|uniref:uncharacterized protein LOC126376948 n=1 Tax=Pectinophora gossypiella TaxID=13191 RepID=UPI00214F2F40|nr:uncharacterized protein LOC126376948 [Pectinophora gossypiella]